MGKRRRGREFALKILYRLDLTGEDWESVREEDLDDYDKTDAVHSFGVALIEAVLGHRESLDEALSSAADNWEIGRMAKVDRNILRVALGEYLVLGETPPAVIIDEAVEIARKFSTESSGRFVNGVLDQVFKTHEAGVLAREGSGENSQSG